MGNNHLKALCQLLYRSINKKVATSHSSGLILFGSTRNGFLVQSWLFVKRSKGIAGKLYLLLILLFGIETVFDWLAMVYRRVDKGFENDSVIFDKVLILGYNSFATGKYLIEIL